MTIVLFNDARNYTEKTILLGVIIVVLFTSYLILVGSKKILSILGDNGNKVLMRIMGLILMVIAVELTFAGLKPMVQEMLGIK